MNRCISCPGLLFAAFVLTCDHVVEKVGKGGLVPTLLKLQLLLLFWLMRLGRHIFGVMRLAVILFTDGLRISMSAPMAALYDRRCGLATAYTVSAS